MRASMMALILVSLLKVGEYHLIAEISSYAVNIKNFCNYNFLKYKDILEIQMIKEKEDIALPGLQIYSYYLSFKDTTSEEYKSLMENKDYLENYALFKTCFFEKEEILGGGIPKIRHYTFSSDLSVHENIVTSTRLTFNLSAIASSYNLFYKELDETFRNLLTSIASLELESYYDFNNSNKDAIVYPLEYVGNKIRLKKRKYIYEGKSYLKFNVYNTVEFKTR